MIEWIIIGLLTTLLLLSLLSNIFLIKRMFDVEDRIMSALDIFDASYGEISKIADMPVFFDSVEVRTVVGQIDKCRDAVLYAAKVISSDPHDNESLKEQEE